MITPVKFPPHQISVLNPSESQKAILQPLHKAYDRLCEQGLQPEADHISGLIWHLNKTWGLIHD